MPSIFEGSYSVPISWHFITVYLDILVGGPDRYGRYQDRREDYVHNDVAITYNAGFQSAIAALKLYQDKIEDKYGFYWKIDESILASF